MKTIRFIIVVALLAVWPAALVAAAVERRRFTRS